MDNKDAEEQSLKEDSYDNLKTGERDNRNDPCTFCGITLKCQVIVVGIYLWIDLSFSILNLYFIWNNQYFDLLYFEVYIILLLPLVVAIMIYSLYYL